MKRPLRYKVTSARWPELEEGAVYRVHVVEVKN